MKQRSIHLFFPVLALLAASCLHAGPELRNQGASCPDGQTCSASRSCLPTCAPDAAPAASVGPLLTVHAHAMIHDIAGQGTSPMTTPPISTQPTGSTFVAFVGSTPDEFSSFSDSKGNRYRQVGTVQSYAGGQGELRLLACNDCAGGSGHTFSLNKSAAWAGGEAVIFAVEVTGAPLVDDHAQSDAQSSPLSAGNVATTQAGDVLIVCALGASYSLPDHYTPSPGFVLLDEQTNGSSSLAGGIAWRTADAPGSYGGALKSSLSPSGAVFLVALGR